MFATHLIRSPDILVAQAFQIFNQVCIGAAHMPRKNGKQVANIYGMFVTC